MGARSLLATISMINPQALAVKTMRYGFKEIAERVACLSKIGVPLSDLGDRPPSSNVLMRLAVEETATPFAVLSDGLP